MSDKIAYAVVTYLGFPYARPTVDSIPKDAPLLVIDNKLLDWPLSKAWNYAIDRLLLKEGNDVIVVCNDDAILQSDTGAWLADGLLHKQFTDDREHKDRELIIVSGYNTEHHPDEGPRWGLGPDFSLFATTKKIFTTMGPFDEGFKLWYEDNDAHWRLQCAGFEAMQYAPYLHVGDGGQTTKTLEALGDSRRQYLHEVFQEGAARYAARWGNRPGQEQLRIPARATVHSFPS